jgi:hypothetical protein
MFYIRFLSEYLLSGNNNQAFMALALVAAARAADA